MFQKGHLTHSKKMQTFTCLMLRKLQITTFSPFAMANECVIVFKATCTTVGPSMYLFKYVGRLCFWLIFRHLKEPYNFNCNACVYIWETTVLIIHLMLFYQKLHLLKYLCMWTAGVKQVVAAINKFCILSKVGFDLRLDQ